MRALAAAILFLVLVSCASSGPLDPDSIECDRIASLARAGEYKPAVDEMTARENRGTTCPEAVLAAVDESRATLAEADAYVHSAQEKKGGGDLLGARKDLRSALEVYPKYYWAQKLQRELEQALAAKDVDPKDQAPQLEPGDQLDLAREAEARADLALASRLITQALEAAPEDPELRQELVEYARLLGLKVFGDGELTQARDLWRLALSLDETNEKLRDYLQGVERRLESLEEIKTEEEGIDLSRGRSRRPRAS